MKILVSYLALFTFSFITLNQLQAQENPHFTWNIEIQGKLLFFLDEDSKYGTKLKNNRPYSVYAENGDFHLVWTSPRGHFIYPRKPILKITRNNNQYLIEAVEELPWKVISIMCEKNSRCNFTVTENGLQNNKLALH